MESSNIQEVHGFSKFQRLRGSSVKTSPTYERNFVFFLLVLGNWQSRRETSYFHFFFVTVLLSTCMHVFAAIVTGEQGRNSILRSLLLSNRNLSCLQVENLTKIHPNNVFNRNHAREKNGRHAKLNKESKRFTYEEEQMVLLCLFKLSNSEPTNNVTGVTLGGEITQQARPIFASLNFLKLFGINLKRRRGAGKKRGPFSPRSLQAEYWLYLRE